MENYFYHIGFCRFFAKIKFRLESEEKIQGFFYSGTFSTGPKITTFSLLVPVQRPQKIEEKNSEKVFYGY